MSYIFNNFIEEIKSPHKLYILLILHYVYSFIVLNNLFYIHISHHDTVGNRTIFNNMVIKFNIFYRNVRNF